MRIHEGFKSSTDFFSRLQTIENYIIWHLVVAHNVWEKIEYRVGGKNNEYWIYLYEFKEPREVLGRINKRGSHNFEHNARNE